MAKKAVRWDEMNKDDFPLEKLVRQYEAFNRAEGKTQRTVQWYTSSLGLFIDYLRSQGIPPVLGSVDIGVAREYILFLQKRHKYEDHPLAAEKEETLAVTSVQNYVRALKAFFHWLSEEGYTEAHRLERLKQPKAPKKLIEPLTEAEIGLIMAALDPNTNWGSRDMAMVLLFLDTGLRLSEALGLELPDLHLEQGYVKVMGKGQKERVVPFEGAAQKALMKYLYHFRPEPKRQDRVFLSLDGHALTANGASHMFSRLGEMAGVERLHAHLLRHTFAVNYLVNGGDVFTLQQMLGHTTLEMVRHYVNLANAHVMTAHRQFSPVDRMNLRQVNRAVASGRRTSRRRR